jgi:hypothetical protein
MMEAILAHAGGLDEMAMLLFPVIVGGGFWALTRTPGRREKATATPQPRRPTTEAPAERPRWG